MAEWLDPPRIDQTEFGDGAGNCHSACLAMLLRMPLSEVPNFNKVSSDREVNHRAKRDWLLAHGWALYSVWSPEVAGSSGGMMNKINHFKGAQRPTHFPWPPARGFYIASGVSPRDTRHSVVYKDGAMWHDPHPDKSGLLVMDYVEFLRPLYPAGLQRIP